MPVLALLNQLVYPAQTAAIPRLVEQEELVSANSMFALAYQGVDAVFNALAGVLVAVVGAVALFTLDAVTFVLAAALFATLSVPRPDAEGTGSDITSGAVPETPIPDPEAVLNAGRPSREEMPVDEDSTPDTNSDTITPDGAGALSSYLADLREGIAYLRGTFVVPMLVGSVVINFALGATIAVLPSYGALIGGAFASLLGPVPVIAAAGVGFLLLAGYVASVPSIRRLPAVDDIDTLAIEHQLS